MEHPISKSKPWMLPFWFMLGIAIIGGLEELFVFITTFKFGKSKYLLLFLIWPSVLFVETIVYWLIRKKITERKWVWAHLLFSLFAFVLLWILYFLVSAVFFYTNRGLLTENIVLLNKIKLYCFWSGIVVGHIFFIVAIVRSFSVKNSLLPDHTDDLLDEVADLRH